jgi:ribonuclease P protein component
MTGQKLRPCERICGDARFQELRRSGTRAGDGVLFVRALPNGLAWSRLGLAVGRSAGGAVRRSRLRRMLREAWRLNRNGLPLGLDLLLAPRAGAAAAPLDGIARSLLALAGEAAGRLGRR